MFIPGCFSSYEIPRSCLCLTCAHHFWHVHMPWGYIWFSKCFNSIFRSCVKLTSIPVHLEILVKKNAVGMQIVFALKGWAKGQMRPPERDLDLIKDHIPKWPKSEFTYSFKKLTVSTTKSNKIRFGPLLLSLNPRVLSHLSKIYQEHISATFNILWESTEFTALENSYIRLCIKEYWDILFSRFTPKMLTSHNSNCTKWCPLFKQNDHIANLCGNICWLSVDALFTSISIIMPLSRQS